MNLSPHIVWLFRGLIAPPRYIRFVFFRGLIAPPESRKGMSIPVLLRYRVMSGGCGGVWHVQLWQNVSFVLHLF